MLDDIVVVVAIIIIITVSQALIGLGTGDSAVSKTKIPPHVELTLWWGMMNNINE